MSDRNQERIDDYLTWSISYYVHDRSLASNNMFDTCCLILKQNYNSLPDWFKKIVSVSDLRAGTGFALKVEQIPQPHQQRVRDRLRSDEEWTHGE